ncbi:MAG TPA: hypothetical protein VHT05_14345, partial [Candidatus Elarobacter sp.]|nr:hypothetical protein [Candidatus Elarobacter sp.]
VASVTDDLSCANGYSPFQTLTQSVAGPFTANALPANWSSFVATAEGFTYPTIPRSDGNYIEEREWLPLVTSNAPFNFDYTLAEQTGPCRVNPGYPKGGNPSTPGQPLPP